MQINLFFNTSPLQNGHAHRGIGTYTKYLLRELQSYPGIVIFSDPNTVDWKNIDMIHDPFFDLFFPTLKIQDHIPQVVTIHDVIPLKYPKYYPSGIKGKFNLFRQKNNLKKVQAVITDSEASKVDINKYLHVPTGSIHVVPLAANPEIGLSIAAGHSDGLADPTLPAKYILYVGDINFNKNIPSLIQAMTQVPAEFKLLCVGKNFVEQDIPEWQAIAKVITDTNLNDRVMFLNQVENATQLSSIYSRATVYVQPSFAEGFGLPILEAMNCQTPVVTIRTSAMPEVAGEYASYADTPTPEAIAGAINNVLSWNQQQLSQVVSAAANWSQDFSWKKTAEMTIAVYKHVKQNFSQS